MQNKHNTISRLSMLLEFSKGSKYLYFSAVIFMAVSILASYFVPQIIMFVVDCVVGGLPMTQPQFVKNIVESVGGIVYLRSHILLIAGLILSVSAVGGISNFLRARLTAVSSEKTIKRMRDTLYSHIQRLPYSWHVGISTGDVIQRCTSDVDVVRNFIGTQFIEMLRTLFLVVFAYIILFSMNFYMALASFVFLPVVFLYSFVFLNKISNRFLAADQAEGLLLSVAQENLTAVRVVRAFGRERHEIDRFDKENENFSNLWVKLGDLLSLYWGASDLITALQMITICVVGVYQSMAGNLTVGGFIVFLSYNTMTIWPVRGLGRILSEASKTGVSLGRLKEILDAPIEEDALDAAKPKLDGDITFNNVSFSYIGQPVLKNISFTIKKGTTLGILGGTGSGKTTIASLLLRLYNIEDENGNITIGGTDIKNIKLSWLRKNIGVVLQEPFLYSRTIEENIASFWPGYSLEDVKNACKTACIDDSIEQFSKGYGTIVGERGVTLSGGQKQRVAIARAIIKDPDIIIFDDSLSAVDTETDMHIRDALSKRPGMCTTIIISHRITSLSKADQIIVLDKGKIAEKGTHDELIELRGIYHRVYDMQSSI